MSHQHRVKSFLVEGIDRLLEYSAGHNPFAEVEGGLDALGPMWSVNVSQW